MSAPSWGSWSKHILAELERLDRCASRIEQSVNDMRSEIAVLKIKSGVWGAVAGFIPAALAIAYLLFKGHLK